MRLGGVVHDRVSGGVERSGQLVDERRVGDVAAHEPHPVVGQPLERGEVAGVRQLIEHDDLVIGVRDDVAYEVRSDEPGAAGDQEPGHASFPLASTSSR